MNEKLRNAKRKQVINVNLNSYNMFSMSNVL